MARMKKGAKTSLKDFNYYGPICVGDIVKDLDTQMECEIDCYGRAMDKAGVDHSKGRLSIVRPNGSNNPPIDIFGEGAKEPEKDFQKDQLEGTEGLMEEASPAGGQETDSETSEATQSSTAEESDTTEGKTEPVTLESFTDQQLADELRTRGYELTATKIIMVPQEIRL